MSTTGTKLTLEEFWALPAGDTNLELVDGQAIPKVSPKYFQSSLQRGIDRLISAWCRGRGRIRPEWSVTLLRFGVPWVPVPDLTYVSYDRLPKNWKRNEACPVPCDLAIEIISPGQTLKEFEEKAADYLIAGVLRVWVIDPDEMSIRVFFPNSDNKVKFYVGDMVILDILLPGLELTPQSVFEEAELI